VELTIIEEETLTCVSVPRAHECPADWRAFSNPTGGGLIKKEVLLPIDDDSRQAYDSEGSSQSRKAGNLGGDSIHKDYMSPASGYNGQVIPLGNDECPRFDNGMA
jgi:hypothetical protein